MARLVIWDAIAPIMKSLQWKMFFYGTTDQWSLQDMLYKIWHGTALTLQMCCISTLRMNLNTLPDKLFHKP